MDYQDILKDLAPCGLSCRKCFGHAQGDIGSHSRELQRLLGEFDIYAKRFSAFLPQFEDYPSFKKLLHYLSQPNCAGCRKGDCIYPNCGVAACYKEKGFDFCFQCSEFPCDKTNFDPHLKERWINMNERMREIGVEGYYEESRDDSRYK